MPLTIVTVSILSLLLSGFQYNVYNNAYHIPIALGWVDDPAFRDDLIVPTLHLFASPIYRLLQPVATETNLPTLFLLLTLAGRIATFWAFDAIGRSVGIEGWPARAAFLMILVTSIGIYTTSAIGADGLLIPYFSHSELAQGIALLSVAAMLRGASIRAALLGGLAFDINLFVGVWMLAPLGLACIARLHAAKWRRDAVMHVIRAAAAFAAVATPVLIWVLYSQAGQPIPAGFHYAAFLQDLFPYHFFIGSATNAERMLVACQVLAAFCAITMLPHRRIVAMIFGALVLVCAAGIVIGETSSNRWLLNLHLMRSAGMIALVATPLVAAAAFLALRDRRPVVSGSAMLVLLGVLTNSWTLVLPAMLILFASLRYVAAVPDGSLLSRGWMLAPVLAAGAVATASVALSTSNCCYGRDVAWNGSKIPDNRDLGGITPTAPFWRDVQLWTRSNTPADAMFLGPTDLDGFRTGARRPVWVTAKDGGAVPWNPALLAPWTARMAEVASLSSVAQLRDYACARKIDYVVVDGRKPIAGFDSPGALFRNRYFAVYPADGSTACQA